MTDAATKPQISAQMTVREIITLVPAAADIMTEYGLHCFSCSIGGVETLEEGAGMHGFDSDTLEALVDDINDAIDQAPSRPQEITITKPAAEGLQQIAKDQKMDDQILMVTLDANGGFCMEFQEKAIEGDLEFSCNEVPDFSIFVSVLTLSRIGGATIDFRDGRFALDLPEDVACCKEGGGGCDCTQ